MYFEDMSQNPFTDPKSPRTLTIGLISKSLLNKTKGKMDSGHIFDVCLAKTIRYENVLKGQFAHVQCNSF